MDELVNGLGVEVAPDSMDLEALLGLSDVDIDGDSPKIAVANEDNVTIEEPHIKIPVQKLNEVLKVSGMISSAGENSFEGKVVVMKVEPGQVRFLLSDNKRNIEKRVDLINTENQFTGLVAFNTSLLARLSKVCSSIFILIERTVETEGKVSKKYVLKIRGGEMYLDNIQMQEDKFVKSYEDKTAKKYKREETANIIKRLFSFASTAIKSGKNIDFMGKVIEAAPINSLAKIFVDSEYPTFKISLTDAKILNALCMMDDVSEISINESGKIFRGGSFDFKTESFSATNCVFDTVADDIFAGESVSVDAQHLIQISDLSCGLDTSVGNLRFNYTDEGMVQCELLTKRENSMITIQGTPNTNLFPMENSVEVQSMNLKGAMTIFSNESVLSMWVTSNGIGLSAGNCRVAVLGKDCGK